MRNSRTEQRFFQKVRAAGLDKWSAASLAERIDQQVGRARKRLFVDVTYLARDDARSGIQRVVRSLLSELLGEDSPMKVEPVYYCTESKRFRYAREFVSRFLQVDVGGLEDEIADIRSGDVVLGLDLNSADVTHMAEHLSSLRASGVRVAFTVYDLLPIRHPDCFVPGAEAGHSRWAQTCVLDLDLAVCISKPLPTI